MDHQHQTRQQIGHRATASLPTPAAALPIRIDWSRASGVVLLHLLALLALVPWFFSWTGVVTAITGIFVFGLLGINIGYHRLLTHRGFKCPKWLEHLLALLGICCLQDSPARWAAIHRIHHKHSDRRPDPHSPLVNFLWGHLGWVLVHHDDHSHYVEYKRQVRDLLRDPFYVFFERRYIWFWTYVAHAFVFALVGLVTGWLMTGGIQGAVQFAASILVWGVFLRTVAQWHNTWAVNSVTHLWGYRNYETNDCSRNNWLIGLLAHGEGWHNNHHADQRAARHGHRWWEFDATYGIIVLLEKLGLASDVVRPRGVNRT